MKKITSIIQEDDIKFPDIQIASDFLMRFLGLMGRRKLNVGQGLLLLNCSSIHTCFMRFPIDVIYLSSDFQILDCETVRPWKLGKLIKGTRHILELSADAGSCLIKGKAIQLKSIDTSLSTNKVEERGKDHAE